MEIAPRRKESAWLGLTTHSKAYSRKARGADPFFTSAAPARGTRVTAKNVGLSPELGDFSATFFFTSLRVVHPHV